MNNMIQKMINRANYINSNNDIPVAIFNQIIDKIFDLCGVYDKLEREIIIQMAEHKKHAMIIIDYKTIIEDIRTELIYYGYMTSEQNIINAIMKFYKLSGIIYKEKVSINEDKKIGLIVYFNKEEN